MYENKYFLWYLVQNLECMHTRGILYSVPMFVQGCYCERLITPGNGQAGGTKQGRDGEEKLVSFLRFTVMTMIRVPSWAEMERKILIFTVRTMISPGVQSRAEMERSCSVFKELHLGQ